MASPPKITGSHLIGRALKLEGVRNIFTLAGDHILPALDVMHDMDFYNLDTRHEQAAVHMADAWGRITGQPGVVRAFETLIISAEEGVRKPQEEIYARTAQRLNVLPGQAVFVDDVLENVEAARACGWLAIHFQPGLNVPQELAQMGVK